MLSNCYSFLIAHNHPSNSNEFSIEDVEATRRIKEASDILDIRMIDHLVITDDSFSSAAALGLL